MPGQEWSARAWSKCVERLKKKEPQKGGDLSWGSRAQEIGFSPSPTPGPFFIRAFWALK